LLRYDDDKVRRLRLEALHQGFNHFKMKVGSNIESDLHRGKVTRSIIDDPLTCLRKETPGAPSTIEGKNAGPTGNVLMIDPNQVWDVHRAVEYVKRLAEIKPWFVEGPTAPDEYVLSLYLSAAFVSFFPPTAIASRD